MPFAQGGLSVLGGARQFAVGPEQAEEQERLLVSAPHLVLPTRVVVPLPFADNALKAAVFRAGVFAERLLGLFDPVHGEATPWDAPGRVDRRVEVAAGAVSYTDLTCISEARLTLSILRAAALNGAVVANYVEAVALDRDRRCLTVRDTVSGATWSLRASVFVNATGAASDQVRFLMGGSKAANRDDSGDNDRRAGSGEDSGREASGAANQLEPLVGVHLIVDRRTGTAAGEGIDAVTLDPRGRSDGHVAFTLPWDVAGRYVCVGDSAPALLKDRQSMAVDAAYVAAVLSSAAQGEPGVGSVCSAWTGLRPALAVAAQGVAPTWTWTTEVDAGARVVSTVGGSIPCYRRMAVDAMAAVRRLIREPEDSDQAEDGRGWQQPASASDAPPLFDGAWAGEDDRLAVESELVRVGSKLDPSTRAHLLASYGTRAPAVAALAEADGDLGTLLAPAAGPWIRAEVVWAARAEMAVTAVDVLARRTRIMFTDPRVARAVAPVVVHLMAPICGWNQDRRQAEIAGVAAACAYFEVVDSS